MKQVTNTEDATKKMKEIRDLVIGLTESPLYKYRIENNYHAVLGEGNHNARIMFIGEAPGKNEAETGRPFCGAAGKILDELLDGISLSRPDVYVTNIVKDRPPGNRDPEPAEIELYAPFLDMQIETVKPEYIVTLGRFSMEYIMNRYGLGKDCGPISKIHGRAFHSQFSYGDVVVYPVYHPAASIYNRTTKEDLVKDFESLKLMINEKKQQK